MKLIVENLEMVYKNNNEPLKVLKKISFKVKENEFLCILGPSGCGKTTILNAIAGFITFKKGKIFLDGELILKPTRKIAVVFQNYALFPWKTVKENISVGLRLNGFPKHQIEKIVNYYLKIMQLKSFQNYYPNELSGGMQQRVAVSRALANNPEIILMDEPFGSLDSQTRINLQEQLLKIWHRHKKTIIFVTHDVDEAILLGDRILVLKDKKVSKEFYISLKRPRNQDLKFDKKFIELKKKIT